MRTFTKDEYISRFKDRYLYATRGARQVILDEICQMFKYHRKYAIRLLNVKEQAHNKPITSLNQPKEGVSLSTMIPRFLRCLQISGKKPIYHALKG